MFILRVLIVTLLCWPLRAGAQSIEWKAIACIAENPEVVRGNAETIYLTDSGQVHFEGTQYPATVNSAEIRFCFSYVTGRQGCYMISRISGRFTITMTGSGGINHRSRLVSRQPAVTRRRGMSERFFPAYAVRRRASRVEEAGPDVSEFKKGDEIYGVTNPQFCGANAQYAVAQANMVALRPSRLSQVEASVRSRDCGHRAG